MVSLRAALLFLRLFFGSDQGLRVNLQSPGLGKGRMMEDQMIKPCHPPGLMKRALSCRKIGSTLLQRAEELLLLPTPSPTTGGQAEFCCLSYCSSQGWSKAENCSDAVLQTCLLQQLSDHLPTPCILLHPTMHIHRARKSCKFCRRKG